MGMSLLYAPFFLIAHCITPFTNFEVNGYSDIYDSCLAVGCFIYLLIGLFYLRKTLLLFFTESISHWVIVSIFFGTNLLWYSFGEYMMPHAFLFLFFSLLIYFTVKWHSAATIKNSVILALICGMIILIRPVDILLCLFPLLYGPTKNYFSYKLDLLKQNSGKILLMIFVIFLTQVPQLLYWKYVSGHWLFYGYKGERFFWDHPHFIDGFFSYRKGWLVYTPLMLFALAGIFSLKKIASTFFIPTIIIFPLFSYVVLSWWIWWYGGSFGARPFIDLYPLLAFPLGTALVFLFTKPAINKIGKGIIVLLIALNILQTYQYDRSIIHFDGMTRTSYWSVFGKIEAPDDWWDHLRLTDPIRTMKGLPEEYSLGEIHSLKLILRDEHNHLMMKDSLGKVLPFKNESWKGAAFFSFQHINSDQTLVKADDNFIGMSEQKEFVLVAEKEKACVFNLKLIKDNEITVFYVSAGFSKNFRVYMTDEK
jgi:hypothetical protein